MKKQLLIFLSILAGLNLPSFGQTGFEKLYAPYVNQGNAAFSVVPSVQSGYIITGTLNDGYGNESLLLMKIDPDGNIIWTKDYGQGDYGQGKCIRQTQDNSYIVCGSAGEGSFILKIDENGDTLWTRIISPNGYTSHALSIWPISDGGYIMSGYIAVPPLSTAWVLIKTNSIGQLMWSRQYGDPHYDYMAIAVRETSNHGLITTGERSTQNGDSSTLFLAKTDSLGELNWVKYFGSTISSGESVLQAPDGGYLCGGMIEEYAIVIRTDPNGDTIWKKQLLPDPSTVYSLYADSDSTFICCVNSYSSNTFVELMKSDLSGNILWSQSYTQGLYHYGFDVEGTPDGGYIIAGEKKTYATRMNSIYIIKTDGNGSITDVDRHLPAPGNIVNLFPNPNRGDFRVESNGDFDQMEITDLLSRTLFCDRLDVGSGLHKNIHLHDQQPGVYFLKLNKPGGGSLYQKFIVW